MCLLDLTTFVPSRTHSSYKPLWGVMSGITASTDAVYAEVKDKLVTKELLGKKNAKSTVACLACFGLTCGAPAALCRFAYVLAFKSRTKMFTQTTNDNAIELFCQEPDAMAVRSIVIRENKLITDRATTAIGFCFRIMTLDLSGCDELSCGLCVYE